MEQTKRKFGEVWHAKISEATQGWIVQGWRLEEFRTEKEARIFAKEILDFKVSGVNQKDVWLG